MPRFYCAEPLTPGALVRLPAHAARHVQVLRMQPGQALTLFPGVDAESNREYDARITEMGRQHVEVQVLGEQVCNREANPAVHLLAGMPANERMDWLVEKATELGAASITPIAAERSMLKLKGERAEKKCAHWQGIAIAASEQCGRNTVPPVASPVSLEQWVKRYQQEGKGNTQTGCAGTLPDTLLVLSPEGAQTLYQWRHAQADALCARQWRRIYVLTGPEGGLSAAELRLATQAGFMPLGLGARILRSETAPLAALALLTAQ